MRYLAPVNSNAKSRNHISEKREGEPFQDRRDPFIRQPNDRECDANSEDDDVYVGVQSRQHFGGIGHARKVRRDVDGVRDQKSERRDDDEGLWNALFERRGGGQVRNAVQRRLVPSCAPAMEYVAIPEGSSSAAPVMRPGPSAERRRRGHFLSVDVPAIVAIRLHLQEDQVKEQDGDSVMHLARMLQRGQWRDS